LQENSATEEKEDEITHTKQRLSIEKQYPNGNP